MLMLGGRSNEEEVARFRSRARKKKRRTVSTPRDDPQRSWLGFAHDIYRLSAENVPVED